MTSSNSSESGARLPVPGVVRAVGCGAAAFGVATVGAGGLVLFGPEAAREAAGHAVPFVVWTNFLAGFAYVAAGAGTARGRRWAVGVAVAVAGVTALAGLAFAAHALSGGAFEPRTVGALLLRAGLWAGIALWARARIGGRCGV